MPLPSPRGLFSIAADLFYPNHGSAWGSAFTQTFKEPADVVTKLGVDQSSTQWTTLLPTTPFMDLKVHSNSMDNYLPGSEHKPTPSAAKNESTNNWITQLSYNEKCSLPISEPKMEIDVPLLQNWTFAQPAEDAFESPKFKGSVGTPLSWLMEPGSPLQLCDIKEPCGLDELAGILDADVSIASVADAKMEICEYQPGEDQLPLNDVPDPLSENPTTTEATDTPSWNYIFDEPPQDCIIICVSDSSVSGLALIYSR